MPAKRVDKESLKTEYFTLASQYYVAGRIAFWATLMPISAILLRHSIELYLKGQLALTWSEQRLRDELGHNLERIWQEFRKGISGGGLNLFNRTISDLHKFERVRYPERVVKLGLMIHMGLQRSDLKQLGHGMKRTDYQVAVAEVDALVARLFELCSLNPRVFLSPSPRIAQWFYESNAAFRNLTTG